MKYQYNLLIRIILCFIPLSFFYFIFTPLTLYATYLLLIYYNPTILGINLLINQYTFTFVEACILGSAYYLLWLLTMLTKDIKLMTRIKMILLGFLLIYIANIIRIIALIFIAINYSLDWFDLVHMFIWVFVTSTYVALVWIFLVRRYKIKSIPIYSDLKYLYEKSLFKKSRKTND